MPCYGIKQAPRVWNETLHKFLIKSNFNQSDANPCVYTRLNKTVKTLMTVCVDDLTLIGTPHHISDVKKLLASRFPITDLGPAKSIFGVEVIWDFKGGTTTLCQRGHIAALLKFANMEDCLPADTPMEEKLRLTFPANPENDPSIPYRLVIGKLLYIALSTRPNIAYAVCYLSCFVSNYGMEHWTAVKRILRYLHKTIDHGIVYSIKPLHEDTKERPILHAFCDSDYADDLQTSKSITGCLFF